jgi:hypothetical protein
MKRIIYLSLLVAFCLTSIAQVSGPRNIIKTDLTAYVPSKYNLISSINLNYEFKINEKFSVGAVGGTLLSSAHELGATGTSGADKLSYKGEITPSGYFINPYGRFYTKEAMTGFYLELFTRYYNYDFQIPYDYEKNNGTITANADANASAFGGGIVIGSQVALGKMFVLDFYAGAGMGLGKFHAETNDPNLDEQDYADIKQEMANIENVEIIFVGNAIKNMTYDANSTSAWADISNIAVPMLRAGISFGVAF